MAFFVQKPQGKGGLAKSRIKLLALSFCTRAGSLGGELSLGIHQLDLDYKEEKHLWNLGHIIYIRGVGKSV